MFELVIFAQVSLAKCTFKNPAGVLPDSSLAFLAIRIQKRTLASMSRETFATVAHPRFTDVANRANHLHSGGMLSRMFYHTVRRLHALLLAALGTYW